MEKSFSESYKEAGVDVTAGYKAVELMKKSVQETYTKGVISDLGGFGGLFKLDTSEMKEPILVSGTDGVGTKLKLAFLLDKHDTIGQDCVAMCVNDIVCCGAKPLFFLDYISLWKNIPEMVASIVKGVADGCRKAGCALVGGETAEMPGLYSDINPDNIQEGDVVIGLTSSGVHSNGFSLVRKIFNVNEENLREYREELGMTLGEALLKPTKIYVKPVLKLIDEVTVKGISHITGGGFYENMPRMLNDNVSLEIQKDAYPVPEIFKLIQKEGNIPERDMYNTFNMGIGMAIIVPESDKEKALKVLEQEGEKAYVIGKVVKGNKEIKVL